jgi:hypothetical protein
VLLEGGGKQMFSIDWISLQGLYMRIFIHIYMYKCVYMYICIHNIYMYIYTCIYTHKYMYTYSRGSNSSSYTISSSLILSKESLILFHLKSKPILEYRFFFFFHEWNVFLIHRWAVLSILYYLYVDPLTCAISWSVFLCRIRFCDTLLVVIFSSKRHHHYRRLNKCTVVGHPSTSTMYQVPLIHISHQLYLNLYLLLTMRTRKKERKTCKD